MPPAASRTQGKRPGDLTGLRGQNLAKARDTQKAEEKAQIVERLEADRIQKSHEEVDYSSEARTKAREQAAAGVVEESTFEPRAKTRRIRVNWPIEDMTFGKEIIKEEEKDDNGNVISPAVLGGLRTYSFEPGRWYTVDTDVADHLAFLEYVYE